jgi:hypothetical protein
VPAASAMTFRLQRYKGAAFGNVSPGLREVFGNGCCYRQY